MAVNEFTGCLVGLVLGCIGIFLGFKCFGLPGALLGYPIGHGFGALMTGFLFTLSDSRAISRARKNKAEERHEFGESPPE
jgi:hypothetical protein